MKNWLLYSLAAIFLFCAVPKVKASFVVKQNSTDQLKVAINSGNVAGETVLSKIESTAISYNSSDATSLPRGRGNGKSAMMAFLFGFFSIFPVLGLIFVPFAFIKGIKNTGRIRKLHGFAIAGLILAVLGVVFTIAILTAA